MSFGYGHRRVNLTKAVAQNARTGELGGFGNQTGAVQRHRVGASMPQQVNSGDNAVSPDQFRLLKHAGQNQIRHIATRDRDTQARLVCICYGLDCGPGGGQVRKISFQVRIRKIHLLCTHWVDEEDGNIPSVGTQAIDHGAGSRISTDTSLIPIRAARARPNSNAIPLTSPVAGFFVAVVELPRPSPIRSTPDCTRSATRGSADL